MDALNDANSIHVCDMYSSVVREFYFKFSYAVFRLIMLIFLRVLMNMTKIRSKFVVHIIYAPMISFLYCENIWGSSRSNLFFGISDSDSKSKIPCGIVFI